MRTDWQHLEPWRVTKNDNGMASKEGDPFGAFFVPRGRTTLRIIATTGSEEVPWEHVSVAALDYKGERCPTWEEMCWVKDLFWNGEEAVVQYHPPESEYVSMMKYVLHLWRPLNETLPRPPAVAVGYKGVVLQS